MKISWAAAGLFLLVLVLATTSALPKCPHCALSGSEKKPCSHCSRLAKAQQIHKPYSAASHDLKYKQTYGDSIATYGARSSLYDASNSNYGSQVYEAASLLHGTANAGTSSPSGSAYNIGTTSNYGGYNTVGQPAAESNGYISQSNCDQYNSVGQSEALQMLNGYGFGSSVGDKFKLDGDLNFGSRSRPYAQAASSYPTSAMNLAPSSSYSNAISSANAQSSAYSAPMNSALSTSYSQAASPAYLGSATLPYRHASVNQAPVSHLYSTSNLPTYTSSAYGNAASSVNPGLPASSYSNAAATAYSSSAASAYSAPTAASYSAAPSINSIPDISSLYPDSIPAPSAPLSFSNAASTAYSQSAASAYPPYSNSANTARSPYAPESLYSELSPYSISTSSSNLAPFSSVQTDCNDSLLKSKYSTKQSVDSYLPSAEYPALASADYTSPAIVYSKPMSAEPHTVPSLAHLASSQGFSSPNEDQPCKSGPTEQEEPNVSMYLVCQNVMTPEMVPPKKYVAEDRLAFGYRQHPADARNQMENLDIPEEKLLTVDKPIFDPDVPCKCKTSLKQKQQETDGANDQSLESYVSYNDHRCYTVALNQPQCNENDGSLLSIPLGPTIPYTYRIADENMNHQSTRDYNDNADSTNGGSCAFKTNIIERIRNLAMHKLYKRV